MMFQVVLPEANRDGYPNGQVREEPEHLVVEGPPVAERQVVRDLVHGCKHSVTPSSQPAPTYPASASD